MYFHNFEIIYQLFLRRYHDCQSVLVEKDLDELVTIFLLKSILFYVPESWFGVFIMDAGGSNVYFIQLWWWLGGGRKG